GRPSTGDGSAGPQRDGFRHPCSGRIAMNNQFAFPYSAGAQLLAPGKTLFRLWAPSATAVHVELDEDELIAMKAEQDSGWYRTEVPCGAGHRYRFRVSLPDGNDLSVPDPASRSQDGDVHGASLVVDPKAYLWQNPEWKG